MNMMSQLSQAPTGENAPDDLWYKDAIVYQLHVKAFADSNNDGIGDFAGLTEKLDYLQELGVTTLWLLPFFPSPGRDDGYDIADYGAINPDFGTMKDFRRFIWEAKRRGLRVIIELVINHTSDQHKWFKRARRSSPNSSARNWYVWSDTDQKYQGTRIIFTDTEKSNWTWDPEAGAFFWHRFFSHQPDLNFDNPRVISAVQQVMKRWLDAGVDGFRLDAIPYLCEREGTNNENLPATHNVIKQMRAALDEYAPGKVFLAEANQWPEDVQQYFGDSDECHMAYHFPLMPRFYMAIAQEDRFPITDILRQTPDIPEKCQWALFLRNHDELTLEMVTDVERDYLWSTYANDPRARINLGIRRRLAPLMDNDRRKIELMNSLLLSFPGTPIIYYGDEIGMGDNIYLGDRNGVRTPMQWSPDRNGGFSRADPARLYAPVIMDPIYGYEAVNVEAQSRSLSSLLNWTKRLISVRKSSLAFGRGSMTLVRPSNRSVLAYVRQHGDEVILCVANLSRSAQATELDLAAWKNRIPQEMLGRTNFPEITERPYVITLAPYGFYWFYLNEKPAQAVELQTPVPEFETLVIPFGATESMLSRTKMVFERDVLPAHLARTKWFPEHSAAAISTDVVGVVALSSNDASSTWLVLFDASHDSSGTARYSLPTRIDWVRFDRQRYNPKALAAVRQGAREGTLFEIATDKQFISLLLDHLRRMTLIEDRDRRIEFTPGSLLSQMPLSDIQSVVAIETGVSNTSALVDETCVVKIYRKIESGLNPEIEIGHFLTELAQFPNAPALLGHVELVDPSGRSALAVVHRFVPNQGNGWDVTSGYLDRFAEDCRLLPAGHKCEASSEQSAYLRYMMQAGRRVAELHGALASRDDIDAFRPEPADESDISSWIDETMQRAERALAKLRRSETARSPSDKRPVEQLAKQLETLASRLQALVPAQGIVKIRQHGDLHLGQLLIAKDDIVIVDFEGKQQRSLAERRNKIPAARDLAGLLRSVEYSTAAAYRRALHLGPDEHGSLAANLAEWRNLSTERLTSAYRETVDSRLWPDDHIAAGRLLKFFLIEDAICTLESAATRHPEHLSDQLDAALRILAEPDPT